MLIRKIDYLHDHKQREWKFTQYLLFVLIMAGAILGGVACFSAMLGILLAGLSGWWIAAAVATFAISVFCFAAWIYIAEGA